MNTSRIFKIRISKGKLLFTDLKRYMLYIFVCMFLSCNSIRKVVSNIKETKTPPNIAWLSQQELTSEDFSNGLKRYSDEGWILKDIDVYEGESKTKYSMIWEYNTNSRNWAASYDLTSEQYQKKWEDYKNKGWMPTAFACYQTGATINYAGIWQENREGIGWVSARNLSPEEYDTLSDKNTALGFRLVDLEVYYLSGVLKFAAIWNENSKNIEWIESRDLSRKAFQKKTTDLISRGYMLSDFESYTVGYIQKYAAIWEKNTTNYKSAVVIDKTKTEYANDWRLYSDMGYRLTDFEACNTPEGLRYAGHWIENDAVLSRYEKQEAINELVGNYQKENTTGGISVAIAREGKVIYQRGFGDADKLEGKNAHGKSVYLVASISKAIAGTLAAKLEVEGQLKDSTKVSLDLTQRTTQYLAIPNSSHTHTVEQLFSHTGCIWHYTTGPKPTGEHFNTALAATQEIWNTPVLNNCTMGSIKNYSTHAYTFIGAVLESVTKRPISRLVEEEIADKYGLSSIKVMFKNTNLEQNYERVVPYADNGEASVYADNSWKVLGGGIESSAVDLARFGYKHLNEEIIDKETRDHRLWKPVNLNTGNGIGWDIKTINGRRVAEHTGNNEGALSHLRIYRDNDLVIAVLSNQRGHDLEKLVDALGNLILKP